MNFKPWNLHFLLPGNPLSSLSPSLSLPLSLLSSSLVCGMSLAGFGPSHSREQFLMRNTVVLVKTTLENILMPLVIYSHLCKVKFSTYQLHMYKRISVLRKLFFFFFLHRLASFVTLLYNNGQYLRRGSGPILLSNHPTQNYFQQAYMFSFLSKWQWEA